MAALDEQDADKLSEILSKLGVEGKVSNIDDLKDLLTPKKTVKVKKERFSFGAEPDQEDDDETGSRSIPAVPKLTWFCGSTPIPKGHVSFVAWKNEVEGLRNLYPDKLVVQAIRRSLKSPAAEDIWHLGDEAEYDEIMEALETGYGDVTEAETLLSELFSTMQGEKESLTEFLSRLRTISYKLSKLDGSNVKNTHELILANFFRGLRDDKLREALRPKKDEFTSVNKMLKEARRLESDQFRRNPPKARTNAVTSKEPQNNDRAWFEQHFHKMEARLKDEVKEQVASVLQMTTQPQWANGQGRGQGGFRGRGGHQGGYRGAHNQTGGSPREQVGTRENNQPLPQENNNHADEFDPSTIICFSCGGTGHYQNGCAFRGHRPNPNYRGSGRGGRR